MGSAECGIDEEGSIRGAGRAARRPRDSFRIPNSALRTPHSALRTVLWQLPDLHSVSREDRDQNAFALAVIPDVRGTRHAGDQLHFLASLVARDGRIAPARGEYPGAADLDPVEPPRAFCDHARRLVPRLPRQNRASPELYDDEALADGVQRDPVRPAQRVP